ncbi:MAG TPA: helix-turn-helix domain-containing protein [Cellulomonadaceae bacterium]|nr:helix-turn-helix domain-containing protein [Cellulomonadaceae bacterium]
MGRWEPNARGRLARAALVLSAEHGYESTTVAEIAAAAGVTERTFYRHFADKADALFPDHDALLVRLADVARQSAGDGAGALDAALAAVGDLATLASAEPDRAALSARVIPTVPVLAGRELVRQRAIVDAVAEALAERGVHAREAHLAAETALGVWRVAVAEWVDAPEGRTLPEVLAAAAEAVRAL